MIYLIKRYGLWRRGEGLGYTRDIAVAGHFTKDEAGEHFKEEGVSIHSAFDLVAQLRNCRTRHEAAIASINDLLGVSYG